MKRRDWILKVTWDVVIAIVWICLAVYMWGTHPDSVPVKAVCVALICASILKAIVAFKLGPSDDDGLSSLADSHEKKEDNSLDKRDVQ